MTHQMTMFHSEDDDFLGVPGLKYFPLLLDPQEAREILDKVDSMLWLDDLKRRVQHYGFKYDYKSRKVDLSMRIGELPEFATDVANKLLDKQLISLMPDQMIVNEYQPGQGISAHVDCEPCFGDEIVTVSLGWAYEMDFINLSDPSIQNSEILDVGSALVLSGEARYHWQHRIRARQSDRKVKRERRVSLTFRNVVLNED